MQGRDQYFHSGDARLRFRDEGAGAPVVFIHGWTLDLDAWEPQAASLAPSMRVIRYDRRGFGLSGGMPGRAADLEDLARLLEHLRLEAATLVGLSQGARVALAFALGHPVCVSALVLDGPPDETGDAPGNSDEDFSIAEFRRTVAEQGVEPFRRAWRNHPLMRLYSADAEIRALADRILARYPAHDLAGAPDAPPPPADAGALARFARPVLVVNGDLDTPARRRAGESLARALPAAERIVLPGAGHLPNLDVPDAYNDALREFVRRQSLAAA
ncbi:MAG TPA: alpha/beta hydrolase [Steroidobacteraceae bacterium]|nr:alpha/beta hydrolase [Steroidobacteraceae bacterium]